MRADAPSFYFVLKRNENGSEGFEVADVLVSTAETVLPGALGNREPVTANEGVPEIQARGRSPQTTKYWKALSLRKEISLAER